MLNIIIPIYKNDFEDYEKTSLISIFKHFEKYKITFISPKSLNLNFLSEIEFIKNYNIETFDDNFFKSIDGYNKLLLDPQFYKRFSNDEFILICQTDVFIFNNDIERWLNLDFDYVGAPWIASNRNFINKFLDRLKNIINKIKNKKVKNTERLFKVGNGGFSLRKTQKFIEISELEALNIKRFITDKPDSEYHIEDVFWSLYVTKIYPNFNIPNWKEALSFCIDRKPQLALKLNNNNLPMACHGFNKSKVKSYWKKYINY